MKIGKKLIALFLGVVMVMSLLPMTALAEGESSELPVCNCQTACTEDKRNETCPVCGAEDATLGQCACSDLSEEEAEVEEEGQTSSEPSPADERSDGDSVTEDQVDAAVVSDALTQDEEETPTEETSGETVTVKPTITWQRTKELVYSETGLSGLYAGTKTGYQTITSSGSGSSRKYTGTISWDFATISAALNREDDVTGEDNVWDYGKSTQYTDTASTEDDTSIVPEEGVSGATWNNRNTSGARDTGSAGSYTVRKFSGTFEWPEGYDLTSDIELVSKNDENYSEIYDAIAADTDLTAAFGGKKVIAINDDMYVFIYKEGTTLSSDNYKDYLAFWTGTAGKGVWSWENNNPQSQHWDSYAYEQTTPATFGNEYALRAFHSVVPNMDVVKAEDSGRTQLSSDTLAKMKQSGTWYAFMDGNAISTVLNNQYKDSISANDKFHIDIYCFDTDKVGGMDELELKLTKAAPTEANVTVRYWLNNVGTDTSADNFLGSGTMTNQKIGDTIKLSDGTATNQLNYMKAVAIVKNNNADVADGKQMNELVVTADSDANIINVVYVPADKKVVYLYAGSSSVAYDGNTHTVKNVTIKEEGYTDIEVTDSVTMASQELNDSTGRDKNVVANITAQRTETNPGIYDVAFSSEPFVRKKSGGSALSNYTVFTYPGKLTITYQPSAAVCTYDFGVTNSYDVLNEVEKAATSITVPEEYQSYVSVGDDKNIIYTPQSLNTGETLTLTLTYAGNYTCQKQISFYPATNVLYEENFMTNTGEKGQWTTESTSAATTPTTVSDNETTVYGYTEAYDSFNQFSNGSALKATLNLNGGKRAHTDDAVILTFTGTGFDLISECGTDTGMLVVGLKGTGDNSTSRVYVVDTYFCGDEEGIISGSGLLDYQVPVVRKLDLPYDTYTVTVYGCLTNGSGASTASQTASSSQKGIMMAAAYGLDSDSGVDVSSILQDLGMEEYLDGDVTVSFMDENSVLNGGTGAGVQQEEKTASTSIFDRLKNFFLGKLSGKSAMLASDGNETASSDNSSNSGDAHVYLDAFRVYKPLNEEETNYAEKEKGLKYGSFYDYMVGSAQDMADDSFSSMVYMEYDGEQDIAVIRDYPKQGPQNEVYLGSGNYVGFVLENYTGNETVMVSAKAVRGEAQLGYVGSDGSSASFVDELPAAEMYYDVTSCVQKKMNTEGTVEYYYLILGNIQGSDEEEVDTSVLALSGIKLAASISPAASEELAGLVNHSKTGDKFNPESFQVAYNTAGVKVGKKTALNVKTSLDVDHIAVYSDASLTSAVKEDVKPNNLKAVEKGKAKIYSFNVSVPIATKGENTFYVVAYDSNGTASAPVAVTITGK